MPTSPERDHPVLVAPPPLIFVIGYALGLGIQAFVPIHLANALDVAGVRIAGVLFVLAGVFLAGSAIATFRRAGTSPVPHRPTTTVVGTGPYRLSRNPIYVGFTLIYVGASLLANAVWPLVLLPIVLAVMHFGVVRREEAYLERKFGDEYRAYRDRTRRWL